LGNVTATIDQNAKVLNRYTYKPFGELLSKEGTAPDPKFLWVGAHGYRQTGKKYADVYIRKRTYDTSCGRWTSRDPLWPGQSAYNYGKSNPIVNLDPAGLLSMALGVCPEPDCCANKEDYFNNIIGFRCHRNGVRGRWVQCPNPLGLAARCAASIRAVTSDDCRHIRQVLQSIGHFCVLSCMHPPTVYDDPTTPWTAAVMCCYQQGVPKLCDVRCCDVQMEDLLSGSNPIGACQAWCLLVHENRHTSVDCIKPPPQDWRQGAPFPFDECCAYYQQVKCLMALFEQQCNLKRTIGTTVKRCVELAERGERCS
jgi:RHS repeat-associated protein